MKELMKFDNELCLFIYLLKIAYKREPKFWVGLNFQIGRWASKELSEPVEVRIDTQHVNMSLK